VNFFAHAFVARRVSRAPAFVLGAMLPDFATMCGARLGPSTHEVLAEGIAEHHRTDDAFHGTPTFVAICRDASATLEARGLGWGAARAVAHVGTELLLDGELAGDAETAADYLAAIAEAAEERAGPHIVFRDPQGTERFRDLHARLSRHGTPSRYREPAFVAEVLVRILGSRPRLAIGHEHRDALEEELVRLQGRVVRAREALVGETLRALGREA
jgi:acyl carrier protein phosphodiesterase